MSDVLALATRLRELDDAALTQAIRDRELRPLGIKDFFDLADLLLDRASIQQRLSRLDRPTLAILAALAISPADAPAGAPPRGPELAARARTAVDALLAEPAPAGITLYSAVAEQLRSWPAFGLPSPEELAAPMPLSALEQRPATDVRFIDRVAAERAFAATASISELLRELEHEPARELAKGGIALPDSKRLAHAMAIDLHGVGAYLAIAAAAGLVAREAGSWLITDDGGAWLVESSGSRWRALAHGWFAALPGDIRSLLRERSGTLWGTGLSRFIDWLYPAGGDWIQDRVARFTEAAELLGITANHAASTAGLALLAEGPDRAAVAMTELLPREIEQVYLQHDLSIVAPGPLSPGIDGRLRTLADPEGRALASSYRVSASSMNRAMAAGETAQSVRQFLGEISLTGIPQPLDYLITEAQAKYGLLRVGEATPAEGFITADVRARTYLRSDDLGLLGTVFVDQNLSALGFVQVSDGRLASRFPLDAVFWNLSDARYPVAAENPAGDIVPLVRRRHARPATTAPADPIADLVERLRLSGEAMPSDAADAWIARQLDTAIRTKSALTVSVRLQDGGVVDYQLEPTSSAGGRLRARDRRSEIERTLPISRITGIAPPLDP